MRLIRRKPRFHFLATVTGLVFSLVFSLSSFSVSASDNALVLPESCNELESMMRQGFECSRDKTPWKIVSAFRTCKGDIEVRDRLVTKDQCSAWENSYNEQYEFISQRYTHLQGCLKAKDTPSFDPEALTYCRSVVAAEKAETEEGPRASSISSEPIVTGFSGALTRPTRRSGLSGGSSRLFNLPNQGNDRHSGNDLPIVNDITAFAVSENPPMEDPLPPGPGDEEAQREPSSEEEPPPAANYSSAQDVRRDIKERIKAVKADPNLTDKQKKNKIDRLRDWERMLLSQIKDGDGLTENELENFEDRMNRFDLQLRSSKDQDSVMARHKLLRERIKSYKDKRSMDEKEYKKLMRKLKRVKKKYRRYNADGELTEEEMEDLDKMLDEIKEDFQKYRVKKVDLEQRLQRAIDKVEELFAEGHLNEGKKNEALQKLERLRGKIAQAGSNVSHDDKLELIRKIGDVVRDVHDRRGRSIQRNRSSS